MRRLVPILMLAPLFACGGGSTPTQPTVQYPAVAGVYINGTNLFQFTFTRLSDNAVGRLACGGSMTVNQTGSALSGSFIQRDGDCASSSPSAGTITGTLAADGGIAAQLTVPGADPNYLTSVFQCVLVSGGQGLNGAITGRTLDMTATIVMDCPADGRIRAVTRIVGTR
jgi:hypothetical protein